MDDLHFLAGKQATQEEFLHTFDALVTDGRQVVLTCDCHPRLADDFTPELTDRLLGGAVWGLTPPDARHPAAGASAKARTRSRRPTRCCASWPSSCAGNVRELEGALHSVRHYGRVTGRPIDLALAREALADLLRHAVRVVRLADVERAVWPCCAWSRRLADQGAGLGGQPPAHGGHVPGPQAHRRGLQRDRRLFGGRNHSTAVAAEKKVRQWLRADAVLELGEPRVRVREVVENIKRELLG